MQTPNPSTPGKGDFETEGRWPRRLSLTASKSRMRKRQPALPLGSQECSVALPICPPLFQSTQHHTWPPRGWDCPGTRGYPQVWDLFRQPLQDQSFCGLMGGKATRCSPRKPGATRVGVPPQSSASHTHSWQRMEHSRPNGLHDGCGEATKCPSLITSSIWLPA